MCASAFGPSSGLDLGSKSFTRRRYAIVGCGARSHMYQDALERTFQSEAELVALCDRNPGRLNLARERSRTHHGSDPKGYLDSDFGLLLRETRPDVVIVLTVDATHHEFIVAAMYGGADVITEKPMTTSVASCRKILEAREKTGRTCRVTFNYRYSPPRSQVKDLLMRGAIGDVTSVEFHWLLDTVHGADYFRRWHSDKASSGGLMIHKATHHFDLVNWWLSAVPISVYATGSRQFYHAATARRLGLSGPHQRCRTCPEKSLCSFHLDLGAVPNLRQMYLEQESHDGYFRDRCVWRDDINIEDTMSVQVAYSSGAQLTYSLQAYNSWEGYTISFNGTKGRLEHSLVEQSYMSGLDVLQGGVKKNGVSTRLIPIRGPAEDLEIWQGEGSHGGGDAILLEDLFGRTPPADPLMRSADERAGAYSIAVGLAANRCFETRQVVQIADILPDVPAPDFPAMPDSRSPLPMPARL